MLHDKAVLSFAKVYTTCFANRVGHRRHRGSGDHGDEDVAVAIAGMLSRRSRKGRGSSSNSSSSTIRYH